jgi:hypothetical protein
MKQIMYASYAAVAPQTAALQRILATSRHRNRLNGVTGILLYGDGLFIQVIEGPPRAIDALYGDIRSDFRHRSVTTIHETFCNTRSYANCSMGLRPLIAPHGADAAFVDLCDALYPEHCEGLPIDIGPVLQHFCGNSIVGPGPNDHWLH